MGTITDEQLLAEVEDVLRTMPPRGTIRHETEENLAWFGRASAVVNMWSPAKAIVFDSHVRSAQSHSAHTAALGIRSLLIILESARHNLRLNTVGPLTLAVGQGSVFDYFDEVRKVIEIAKSDLLFVDPYLDAEFVSRYLPQVAQAVSIRLLARERIPTLLAAVALMRKQSNLTIDVRSVGGFHDRYVFVDKGTCYQSGASFKDGAKKAPTTLTQITDAFGAVYATYEQFWTSATIHP